MGFVDHHQVKRMYVQITLIQEQSVLSKYKIIFICVTLFQRPLSFVFPCS